MLADQTYNRLKGAIWDLAGKFRGGSQFRDAVSKIDSSVKSLLVPGVLFEKLGLRYLGPIDGHDIEGLIRVLGQIKDLSGPLLLHVRTIKGKGYKPAEEDDCRLHGVSKFDKVTGKSEKSTVPSFTKVFGRTAVELAAADDKVVAITAAMSAGTGLDEFARKYPDRFFDVGIAEQHAVVFAAGLALSGSKPIAAIYSTFLQRAFDPVLHDLALQRLPVVLAVDRAGLVGNDGPTHHGCFDISYLRVVPNLQLLAPRDGTELRQLLRQAVSRSEGPIAIRYPRSSIPEGVLEDRPEPAWGAWELMRDGEDVLILAVGSMVSSALVDAEQLQRRHIDVSVVNCRFVKPFDEQMMTDLSGRFSRIVTVEEGALPGGFGAAVIEWLNDRGIPDIRVKRLGIPDSFIDHGNRDTLMRLLSLHPEGITASVAEFAGQREFRRMVVPRAPEDAGRLKREWSVTGKGKE
jgi:1-deoxy-D-xylulose-5-phosphate synthase